MPKQAVSGVPVCLGRPMGPPPLVGLDLAARLVAPDWVLVLQEIRSKVSVWNDGRWQWLHLSGNQEDAGKAPEGPVTAAARAQESILRRARDTLAMVETASEKVRGK